MGGGQGSEKLSCFAYIFGFPMKFRAFWVYTRGVQTKICPLTYAKFSGAFGAKLGPTVVLTSSTVWTLLGGWGWGMGVGVDIVGGGGGAAPPPPPDDDYDYDLPV